MLNIKFSALSSVGAQFFCFTLVILPANLMTFLNQKISLMLAYFVYYGRNSDCNSECGTDPQHLSVGEFIAQADFRMDFGT